MKKLILLTLTLFACNSSPATSAHMPESTADKSVLLNCDQDLTDCMNRCHNSGTNSEEYDCMQSCKSTHKKCGH